MDPYTLIVKWLFVEYEVLDEKLIKLSGAYLAGPVLKHARKIQPNDNIKLDFTEQYAGKIPDYYIATLGWSSVKYVGGIVYLSGCTLTCAYKNVLPKLKNDDFIIVGTHMHEEKTHKYFLTYPAELYSAFGEAYGF